jgi:hypothetical protein
MALLLAVLSSCCKADNAIGFLPIARAVTMVGKCFIVYEATDSSGNTSRITRIVTVYE